MNDVVIVRWVLRRNCVLTPGQLLASFAGVAALQAMVGVAFAVIGYPVVAACCLVEELGIVVALLAYLPSARDSEALVLRRGPEGVRLLVEEHHAATVRTTGFDPAWVRVSLDATDPHALLTLSAGGREVKVGRHVLPTERQRVARELRAALTGAAAS